MLLLVDEDNICTLILIHLVPEETQDIALANTALTRQDDNGVFTQIAFNLFQITLS